MKTHKEYTAWVNGPDVTFPTVTIVADTLAAAKAAAIIHFGADVMIMIDTDHDQDYPPLPRVIINQPDAPEPAPAPAFCWINQ